MRAYQRAIGLRDFRLLWAGSTASIFGDSMTLIALIWLVYSRNGSAGAVAGLLVAYGAPVAIGGLGAGWVLVRFGAVRTLMVDSLLRATVVASVPACAALGSVPGVLPYVVAGSYGLAKMLPLAGVPALIAELVPPAQHDAANALEMIAYGLGSVAGPAVAGAMIGATGPEWVLAVDAATFLTFAACLAGMQPVARAPETPGSIGSVATAVRFAIRSAPIRNTTLMFTTFNIGLGVVLVLLPVYAREVLDSGAGAYGALGAALAAGELAGALLAGAVPTHLSATRRIAMAQTLSGASILALALRPGLPGAAAALFLGGLFSGPMTVWAQSLRMQLTPPHLRVHLFAILRTTMQAAPPVGASIGGVLVTAGAGVAAAVAAAACGGPGVAGWFTPSPAPAASKQSNPEPAPERGSQVAAPIE